MKCAVHADDPTANTPGSLVGARGGGGGGRGGGGGGRRGTWRRRWWRRHGAALGRRHGGVLSGHDLRQEPDQVGPKTFLDRVVIKTGEKTRIYESDNNNVYERVSTILDPDAKKFIVVARERRRRRRRAS